ncbi:MAG: FtsQ-type POTRA domain-containing protein [Candidatus Margulisbacteria bacterium]|nr:FtsQ-type POTRA domain-containing protein [Candidatus Margulisiibacteriota bacterium]
MKARTKTRKKRSPRFRFFLSLVFGFLFCICLYYFLSLPIWEITEVAVNGTNMLSANEIKNLSGIPLGENLFFTSFARTRNNLRRITAIERFHLYRLPPGTVIVSITERKPIAVVLLAGKSAVVDKNGYILNRNSNLSLNVPNMTDLPVVAGLGSREVIDDEKIDPKASHLIADIIIELSNLLGSKHISLETGGFEKISFLLDDLLRIKVGRDENIPRKMEVFKALLAKVSDNWSKVEYIDVRYPNNPVIKFK